MKINLKLNEIKFIPHLCKNPLSKDILTAWAPWQWKTTLFFWVLCRRGDLPSSTW